MSTPESSERRRSPRFLLPVRAWLIIAAAFAAGLLLSALLWLGRDEDRPAAPLAGPAPQDGADPARALPAPRAADTDGASGMAEADPAAVPRPLERPPAQDPTSGIDTAPAAEAMTAIASRPPVAVDTPAPRYPSAALRRGESGEVLLRVEVAADGRARAVEVVRSSSSRALDRAAVAAVRRWRFQPALHDGRPVAGTVQVPIDFSPGG
ncbi:energy transducer TonB [Luteimonas sp. SJ-92]|uniref:Energy transducer TonB n=1 Tax=Luteimonas salinisoli TaxID=2752307 RepID=A0A853JBA3_9GAMM|nr:energy transducer TonB [Luteimonas salinisoli]NZA26042.1 energy transducer TonB [Luteimonas salinisoli]